MVFHQSEDYWFSQQVEMSLGKILNLKLLPMAYQWCVCVSPDEVAPYMKAFTPTQFVNAKIILYNCKEFTMVQANVANANTQFIQSIASCIYLLLCYLQVWRNVV